MKIKIYKLSDQEFNTPGEVIEFLKIGLPNRNGHFLIRSDKNVSDEAHIAVFKWGNRKWGNRFYGQAYAIEKIIGLEGYPGKDTTFISEGGEEMKYEARILFDVNSVWIYEGEFLNEDFENINQYIKGQSFTNEIKDKNDYLDFLKAVISLTNSDIIEKLPNYLKSKELLREIKVLLIDDISEERKETLGEDLDKMLGAVVKIAWSEERWKGFDEIGSKNRKKYGYSFVQENGHAHEWWNFYENFENDWYYARVQFTQHPTRFKEDGLVLFISKNVFDYKTYFTGIYGKAKFGYFKTGIEFKDLLPESYLSRIDKESNEYTKALFENFEHEPNFKGLKSFSTNFDKDAYILIEAGDIGIKKFGHAPFCYIGDREVCKIEYAINLLNKAKNTHEKLLLRDLGDERKSNINRIINKIDKILVEYFSDKKREINYWRINIGVDPEEWAGLIRENKIGIGFASEYIKEKLFEYKDREELKNDLIRIKKEIEDEHIDPPSAASQIWRFLKEIKEGDKIVANKGYEILGIGEAGEDVWFEEINEHPITRRINWIKKFSPIRIVKELEPYFRGTLKSISSDHYKTILEMIPEDIKIEFDEELEKIYQIIEYKKQIILYGPPGTGKTFTARKFSLYKSVDKTYYLEYKDEIKREELIELIRYLTFHPSYSYEEFIEGLKPVIDKVDNAKIYYNVEEGLFKTACRDAFNILLHYCNIPVFWKQGEEIPELKYNEKSKILNIIKLKNYPKIFLIIDEINRGDISRIFGELITLLEMDKRLFAEEELIVNLPYSKKRFGIPPNLYLIGTLNTADRSIALLDFALRRRFSFIEFMPDYDLLEDLLIVKGLDSKIIDLRKLSIKVLEVINKRISEIYDKDHQIGHSYLICLKDELNYEKSLDKLRTIWLSELIPLLREYFYESEKKLKIVLNNIELSDFEEEDLIQILRQIGKKDID